MAGRDSIRIPARLLARLRFLAEASLPEECCGVLLGHAGSDREAKAVRVRSIHPAANASADARNAYEIRPRELVAAHRRARAAGQEIVGYYHSHPAGAARPSGSDREAAWPETSYVILGFDGNALTELRCWRLSDGSPGGPRFEEQTIVPVEVSGAERP